MTFAGIVRWHDGAWDWPSAASYGCAVLLAGAWFARQAERRARVAAVRDRLLRAAHG